MRYTNVTCRLLDLTSCRCKRYGERQRLVPDCAVLSPGNLAALRWMPETCAYRLLAEGRDLPSWHPLVTGDPDSVRAAGMGVNVYGIPEDEAGPPEEHML